jgi:hypothetical protein
MKNVIKQSESVSSNVERGIDFGKVKLSKKVIQKSLELETLFKSNDKVYINDSFSDYSPSYMISFKYKNPNGKKDGIRYNYFYVGEVFPKKNHYDVRDYRILEDDKEMFGFTWKKYKNLEEMINDLMDSKFSFSVSGMTDCNDVRSSYDLLTVGDEHSDENLQELHRNEFEQYFDFDKEELKQQLLETIKN